jgi:hypothetical protein
MRGIEADKNGWQKGKCSQGADVFHCSSSSRRSSRHLEGVALHLDDASMQPARDV